MQGLIEILNDWRPVWICGAGLWAAWMVLRQLAGTIDDFQGERPMVNTLRKHKNDLVFIIAVMAGAIAVCLLADGCTFTNCCG